MVINIDISIADSDGTVLHHFNNRFDENDACPKKQEPRPLQSIEFDDFLAEYLSCSGFVIREKLIYGSYPVDAEQSSSIFTINKDIMNDKEALYRFEDSEMEYKIRIGDHKILTGKIPLRLPLFPKEDIPRHKHKETKLPDTIKDEQGEIEGILNYTMIKAIEKYEANLSPSWVEPEDREAEFVLEE
jgi:hypothetical protein